MASSGCASAPLPLSLGSAGLGGGRAALGGLTSFYLQTVSITWGEAEEVEKAFRTVSNKRFARWVSVCEVAA